MQCSNALRKLFFSLLKAEIFRGLGTKLGNISIAGMRISQNLDFYHRICTKTDNVVFRFATSECRRYLNLTIVRKGLVLLYAYQEYLMTFKLMTSQVVQRARPLITHICVIDIQRVNLVMFI